MAPMQSLLILIASSDRTRSGGDSAKTIRKHNGQIKTSLAVDVFGDKLLRWRLRLRDKTLQRLGFTVNRFNQSLDLGYGRSVLDVSSGQQ